MLSVHEISQLNYFDKIKIIDCVIYPELTNKIKHLTYYKKNHYMQCV